MTTDPRTIESLTSYLTKALKCAREGDMLHALECLGHVDRIDLEHDDEEVPQFIMSLRQEVHAAIYTYDRLAYLTYDDSDDE